MSAIPQTMTTMEAGFTVNQADAEEFWRHQERMGPVAAAASGFLAVIGGPIARSPWLYFCGKWQTPDLMDQWYRDGKHKPPTTAGSAPAIFASGACRTTASKLLDLSFARPQSRPMRRPRQQRSIRCSTGSIRPCRHSIRGRSRRSPADTSVNLISSSDRCRSSRRRHQSAICCSRTGIRRKPQSAGSRQT